MNPTKIIGVILIVAGCLGLVYGGFSYTKETTGVKLGTLELKIQEKENVTVPPAVSAGGAAPGFSLPLVGGRKERPAGPPKSGTRLEQARPQARHPFLEPER